MNRLFPTPTGYHAIAQGNALGSWDIRPTNFPSPERATWFFASTDDPPHNSPPLQGGTAYGHVLVPRALPWAFTVRPDGALNHLEATQ